MPYKALTANNVALTFEHFLSTNHFSGLTSPSSMCREFKWLHYKALGWAPPNERQQQQQQEQPQQQRHRLQLQRKRAAAADEDADVVRSEDQAEEEQQELQQRQQQQQQQQQARERELDAVQAEGEQGLLDSQEQEVSGSRAVRVWKLSLLRAASARTCFLHPCMAAHDARSLNSESECLSWFLVVSLLHMC